MATSRSIRLGASRLVRQKGINVRVGSSVFWNDSWRCNSSSTFSGFVPEAIRDAVKSSLLEEVAKPNSKFWEEVPKTKATRKRVNIEHKTHVNGIRNKNDGGDINSGSSSIPSVNEAINPRRISLLEDPLTEWYLDRQPARPMHTLPEGVRSKEDGADPFVLSKADMDRLSEDIRRDLIGTDHPVLRSAASYFFEAGQDGGKKVRPMMVLLISRTILSMASTDQHYQRSDLFEAQCRLAEITEMIHTASLFHDDVIDGAETRRGVPAVHQVFGNKVAILAGDYLLARASVYLARLRDTEVVETMSTIIGHLVRGEVMQMSSGGIATAGAPQADLARDRMIFYLQKTFYKTGSLMANSCKSAAILGGYDDAVVSASYRYGKHVGMAFQLMDDVLDYEGSAATLGKPALADLNAGLATAPLLYAAELYPQQLLPLMERKFRNDGDVATALDLVRKSNGIQRSKDLALVHAELAMDAILEQMPPTPYRDSLIHLAYLVVNRSR